MKLYCVYLCILTCGVDRDPPGKCFVICLVITSSRAGIPGYLLVFVRAYIHTVIMCYRLRLDS